MTPALAALDELVGEATHAASAFDGPRLEAAVGRLASAVEKLERDDKLERADLVRTQEQLARFVKLCEGLHETLLGTLRSCLTYAQPPTYAHVARERRALSDHFSYGYLRRYG